MPESVTSADKKGLILVVPNKVVTLAVIVVLLLLIYRTWRCER